MNAISVYSGAGGLDYGLVKSGFNITFANDFDKNSCATYSRNIGDHIVCGDIDDMKGLLSQYVNSIDLLAGGPPCQGFSVAGKMNPSDPRSKHVWTFAELVKTLQPRAFIMENVKALGTLHKWSPLREALLRSFRGSGYATNYVILNSSEFDVPQSRQRVFFIGFLLNSTIVPDLNQMLNPYRKTAQTVRQTLSVLDPAGSGNNSRLTKAKITLTPKPVLRKSPYAGMLFNGLGRPTRIDGYSATLPASMGGNKTPIIDELELYENKSSWIEKYHSGLMKGNKPSSFKEAPKRLRRLTYKEAALLQSFPLDFIFEGSQSSIFKQIGNAVPCNLGYRVGLMVKDVLEQADMDSFLYSFPSQLALDHVSFN